MKKILFALLYTATAALANPALADLSLAEAAREGDMKKLIFADPKPVGQSDFASFEGEALNLKDWRGKWVLLNFWATWCAPCRKEMPMLSELQSEFGGDSFEVLTIATSRNPPQAMQAFFNEIGVTNLPLHVDPKSALAREMAVLGLPATIVIDPDGNEVARLRGDADWASDSAKAVIRALIAPPGG
jgi:thiol-disulfide isomerase/thioredoxin